jgi:hypothetical protein
MDCPPLSSPPLMVTLTCASSCWRMVLALSPRCGACVAPVFACPTPPLHRRCSPHFPLHFLPPLSPSSSTSAHPGQSAGSLSCTHHADPTCTKCVRLPFLYQDLIGFTPLHYAAYAGRCAVVELLCRRLALRGLTVETAIEAGDGDAGASVGPAVPGTGTSALRVHRDAVHAFRQTVRAAVCLVAVA